MSAAWAICVAREDAASLASLRLTTGIELCEEGPVLWLRGPECDERLEAGLAGLPARERFRLLPGGQLRRTDRRIPSARLPGQRWQSLESWLRVEMPAAALPAALPGRVPLKLVRSSREQEPDILLTTLDEFRRFAATAAQVRLERLQFAVNQEGSVLVRGQPLPPAPGRRFVLYGSVAVPAGFAWEPAVDAEVLARVFGVASGTIALWTEAGIIARLQAEQFVPASRSAIRATALREVNQGEDQPSLKSRFDLAGEDDDEDEHENEIGGS